MNKNSINLTRQELQEEKNLVELEYRDLLRRVADKNVTPRIDHYISNMVANYSLEISHLDRAITALDHLETFRREVL